MSQTNSTRMNAIRSILVELGGDLGSKRASFVRSFGQLSPFENAIFTHIEDTIITESIRIAKDLEVMAEADYQMRTQ